MMDCDYITDSIDVMILGSSLPYFLCCVIFCVVLSFAMIINLLV